MPTEKEWLASAGISIVKVDQVDLSEPFYMEFTEFPGGPDGPLVDSVSATESNRCSWEPNPHGGEWEINGEGWWRIGPFYRSRYSVGDVVYGLSLRSQRYWKTCDVCDGTNKVIVAGHEDVTTYCPMKHGGDGRVWLESQGQFFVIDCLTIGQLRIQVGFQPEVRYMCEET